jgi:dihydrofolate reductase
MRKIVMFNRITLDGFFARPNGEIDWFIHDPEVDIARHKMMNPDTFLSGRVTYQMFENYWPNVGRDPNAPQDARKIADELNQMTKVVFSKTLKEVTWENSKLVAGDVVKEASKLKQGNGPDIVIFGSGSIVQQLAGEGLIDEYLIVVTPVVLGTGKTLFQDVEMFNLELLETRNYDTGNVLLRYRSAKSEE